MQDLKASVLPSLFAARNSLDAIESVAEIPIISPESAPVKRIIQEARDRSTLIDATYGRRTRAVIITDSDHVILSALTPDVLAARWEEKQEDKEHG